MRGKEENHNVLIYGINDTPPLSLILFFGMQQAMLSITSTISIPLIVADQVCASENDIVKAELLGTFLFLCGICTFLQCTFGVRLPIIQGGCHKFIPAVIALMSLEKWSCPTATHPLPGNHTSGPTDETEIWQTRLREIQGGIIIASITQVVLGCTGAMGIVLRWIGPLTVVPTISLVGLALFPVANNYCEKHWGIAFLTIALLLLFSLFLGKLQVPLPAATCRKGCYIARYPIFKLLPVVFAIAVVWGFCGLLTVYDVLPTNKNETGFYARTDARSHVLQTAKWFFFPYPGQWGMPTVSFASYFAMLAATFTSMIESVGDYYACARVCGVRPPPAHAVNRGIAMEGLGSILSGAFGSGGATTSYSQNVGAIGFTKVGSRLVFQLAGIIFILCGVFGKFGAVLTMLPDPILGGVIAVSFGMVSAIGFSNLQFVDLKSSRNLCILGLSMLLGFMVPIWITKNPGAIETGSIEVNQIITVMLSTSMFVGGITGFILDNTAPGTDDERGIIKWRQVSIVDDSGNKMATEDEPLELAEVKATHGEDSENESSKTALQCETVCDVYDLPYIMPRLRRMTCAKYIPILPTFHTWSSSCCKRDKSIDRQ